MLTLDQLSKTFQVENLKSLPVKGVSIDSRSVETGDLFFALSGPRFDGHNFVDQALTRGAIAAVVSQDMANSQHCIKVPCVNWALKQMAQYTRKQFQGRMWAITGSCGKTSTRHMTAHILQTVDSAVFQTQGNLNNHFGVPLMLSRMCQPYRYAVFECGASGPDEIAPLANLIQPEVAAITNVFNAHIAGFGSIATTARTKGQIFESLPKHGLAVMPHVSPFKQLWQSQAHAAHILTFGLTKGADVFADQITYNTQATTARLHTPLGTCSLVLPIPGEAMLSNALAAIAMVLQEFKDVQSIANAFVNYRPASQRLCFRPGFHHGLTVIDDCYNANPASFSAAVDVLAMQSGTKFAVVGDMAELGVESAQAHKALGELLHQSGVEKLWAYGAESKHVVNAFGINGQWFDSLQTMKVAVKQDLSELENAVVLVKGSRAAQLEQVVSDIIA